VNCFSYQSFDAYQFQFQFQPMSFGNCQPSYPSLPPVCGPQGWNYLGESQFWAQCMQAQQSLYQGWQQYCGCQQPPEIHVHHHYHDCRPPKQHHCPQPQPQPQQQPPRPRPPLPRPPLTRTPPIVAPPRTQTRPLPPLPAPPTRDIAGTRAAHTFGAFGPGGGNTDRVTNASYANNTSGGQAVTLGSLNSGIAASVRTHQTSVTVSGYYP
jgi:hypothetical protein